jgi:hypothetical protein
VVQAIYGAWRTGQSARDWIAEDIEYVNPPDAVEPGVRHGRKWFAAITASYDEVVVEPLDYIDAPGDDVVVLARLTGRGRGSGFPVEWQQGYVWTIRDGTAVRFQWFSRPEDALKAAGIG